MMRKWKKCIIGALLLTSIIGIPVLAAKGDFPASDDKGKITIHSIDVDDFENLQGTTGEKVDESNLPNGSKTLTDVTYKIQRLDDSTSNVISVDNDIDPSFAERSGRTDVNGELVFSDLPKGYYLITEEIPSGYYSQKSSFIVMLPLRTITTGNSDSWNYDVHVYPKNMLGAVITKVADGNKVVGVGSEVTWKINYEVGKDIKKVTESGTVYAEDFYITDTMDSRLDYVDGSAVFQLYDRDGKTVNLKLEKDADYTETYNKSTNTLTWEYTDVGIRTLADNEIASVFVSIKTLVNESAINTVEVIWNNASIDFTNVNGDPYHLDVFAQNSDKNGVDVPKVYLGSITIDKFEKNNANKKLANVGFKIASTQEDANAGNYLKTGNKDYEVITDQQGKAMFMALESGDYWLVETKTADGYELLEKPVKVTIGTESDQSNVLIAIGNVKSYKTIDSGNGDRGKPGGSSTGKLPYVTTGDVTRIFPFVITLGGAVFVIFLLLIRRRKESSAAVKKNER